MEYREIFAAPDDVDATGPKSGRGRPLTDGGNQSGQTDPSSPVAVARSHPVLLFDGVCNLCNRWVQFVIERDTAATIRFAPLQSDVAQELLADAGYTGGPLDAVVLIEDGEYYTKSTAAMRTARHLDGPLRLVGPLRYVPRGLRDAVYDFVADRRYRWFGRRDKCMRPEPALEDRFLETDGPAESDAE